MWNITVLLFSYFIFENALGYYFMSKFRGWNKKKSENKDSYKHARICGYLLLFFSVIRDWQIVESQMEAEQDIVYSSSSQKILRIQFLIFLFLHFWSRYLAYTTHSFAEILVPLHYLNQKLAATTKEQITSRSIISNFYVAPWLLYVSIFAYRPSTTAFFPVIMFPVLIFVTLRFQEKNNFLKDMKIGNIGGFISSLFPTKTEIGSA